METLFQRLGRQLRSLFLKQLALGLAFLLAVLLLGGTLPGALLGSAAGLADTALFLWGVRRGWKRNRPRPPFPCTGSCSCESPYCWGSPWRHSGENGSRCWSFPVS